MAEEPVEVTKTEARAGSAVGPTRYVLWISMALVIVLFAGIVAAGWMR